MRIVNIVFYIISFYIFSCSLYYFILTVLFTLSDKEKKSHTASGPAKSKFLILIPAHNEEKVLSRLLKSIAELNYSKSLYTCCVICDNCDDNTEKIAIEMGATALRRTNHTKKGKGYAIEWALGQLKTDDFDIIVMTDADTTVDKRLLNQLDLKFSGKNVEAVQCYNGVLNPNDSQLTRLIELARALEIIYMEARSYIGLTVPLIGNGMCFRPSILKKYPWNAFSISEDLEYFCTLATNDIRIHYSYSSRIYLKEERKLSHAKTQRQRWSGGRFPLIMGYVPRMLWNSLKTLSPWQAGASLALLVPNPSMLGNFIVTAFVLSLIITSWRVSRILIYASFLMLLIHFLSAFIIVRVNRKNLFSLMMVPVYLVWKGLIDLRAVVAKRDRWQKTERR